MIYLLQIWKLILLSSLLTAENKVAKAAGCMGINLEEIVALNQTESAMDLKYHKLEEIQLFNCSQLLS